MIRTFSLFGTIQASSARRPAFSRLSAQTRPLHIFISLVLTGVNVLLLLSYFAGVNKYASSGYEIKQIQANITRLAEENRKLTVQMSERTSMNQLQNEIAGNPSFVAAGTPRYIQVNQYSKK